MTQAHPCQHNDTTESIGPFGWMWLCNLCGTGGYGAAPNAPDRQYSRRLQSWDNGGIATDPKIADP